MRYWKSALTLKLKKRMKDYFAGRWINGFPWTQW
jgi:hypothetical protein